MIRTALLLFTHPPSPPSPPAAQPLGRRSLPPREAARAWLHGLLLALLAAAWLPAPPAAAQAAEDDPSLPLVSEWAALPGVFDVGTGDEVGEVGFEARFRTFRLALGSLKLPVEPAAGVMAHSDGGGYAYGSLRVSVADVWPRALPERWRVVPFVGAGVYEAGDGKDLGGPVEFRSGVEVSYRMGRRWWLGATLYHLSNAVIYEANPGEESLAVTISWR